MVVMRVAVIGGGIVGAAAAHVLSGRGVSVTVVDGSYEGQATRAGAGIVCPWVDHPDDEDWYRLTREGARRYPRLMAELSAESGYARVGALLVAEDPGDLEPVRALLKRRHAEAPEMGEVTSVAAPSSLFPPLAEDLCALLVPGAARVDGRAVRDALLRAAVRQGAEVVTGTAGLTPDGQVLVRDVRESDAAGRVAGVAPGPADQESWRQATPDPARRAPGGSASGVAVPPVLGGPPRGMAGPPAASESPSGGAGQEKDRRHGVAGEGSGVPSCTEEDVVAGGEVADAHERFTAEGTPLDADVVIVAAGAWTGEVCRDLGVELPVFPRRGQIVHATLEGADTSRWPIVLPHAGPYLLGFAGSRVVVGATVEDVGFVPRVTLGGLDEVLQAGLRVAPGLFGAVVAETRVGLRPVHAPGPPLIARLTDRVVVATGLSAYGLTAGPFAGLVAAALALGEEPPIDVSPYRPR